MTLRSCISPSLLGVKLAGLVTGGRVTPQTHASEVMFDFSRIDEILIDPRRYESNLKGKERKFTENTMDSYWHC
jgi:cystathionine beta-synthase